MLEIRLLIFLAKSAKEGGGEGGGGRGEGRGVSENSGKALSGEMHSRMTPYVTLSLMCFRPSSVICNVL